MPRPFIKLTLTAPGASQLKRWANKSLRGAMDEAYQLQDAVLRMRTVKPNTDPVEYDYAEVQTQFGFPTEADAKTWAELLLGVLEAEVATENIRDLASMV